MTKIRSNVILAGVVGPSSAKVGSMMYLRSAPPWARKKSVVLANMPYTAWRPTEKQKIIREELSRIAKSMKGTPEAKYNRKERLTGVAIAVRDRMKGMRAESMARGIGERELGARVYPRRRRYY